MKKFTLIIVLFCVPLMAKNSLFEKSTEHSFKMYMQTPELVEAMNGDPLHFQIFNNNGLYNENWVQRMALYYYSPDSLQIITYLFDYIETKKDMLFPVSKMVEEGEFVLISVSYAPAFLYHLQARQASLSKN